MIISAIFNPRRLAEVTSSTTLRLLHHRALLVEQLRQDIFDPHAGQMAGGLWLLVHPLFLMLVYVVVFAVVFQARIGGTYELPLDYTAYILSGVIPWLAAQQALTRACSALTSSANLIKQVVFPIDVLPAKSVLSSFVPLGVSVLLLLAYSVIFYGALPWTYALLPFLLMMQLMWWLGLGFLLAALTVFVRDLRELVQMFSLAGLFLAPILYLPQWVPAAFKPIIYINPFSYLIWCYRDVLYFGRIEHPFAWLFVLLFAVVIYVLGIRVFHGLKPYFGDAL